MENAAYDINTEYIPNHVYQSPYKVDFKNPDYTSIFEARSKALAKIRKDNAWPLVKRFYADGNYIALIEDWFCTYDPRLSAKGLPTTVPLILFDRQIEYIEALQKSYETGADLAVGKSRDMGISVCSLAWATCHWLMSPGVKISFGSRKEDLVDKMGDPDSLLEKIRMFLRFLPHELLPAGYTDSKHARFLKILNPVNGASITGEAGDNIGRGGRSSAYIVDEAAFLDRPQKIDAALSQNTSCRIDVSTPNGPDNPFANKWFENDEIDKFAFHWTQDPRKDIEWYQRECRRLNDPQVIAQELDLDFHTSGDEPVIHSEWVQSSIALRKYLRAKGELPLEKKDGVAGCDVGGGVAENTYVSLHGNMLGKVIAWVDDDTTNTAHKFNRYARSEGVTRINYDSIGVGRGVVSTFRRIPTESYGIDVGKTASNERWPDGKKASDKFRNIKAELWWILRDRLRRTHDHWMWLQDPDKGAECDWDTLLLLPEGDPETARQLCIPLYKKLESGKIQIESKDALKLRGVRSPDRAEAIILALAKKPPQFRTGRTSGVI